MRNDRPCSECFYYKRCVDDKYPYIDPGLSVKINNIDERRNIYSKLSDCFKSPKQHQLDLDSAQKSQLKENGGWK